MVSQCLEIGPPPHLLHTLEPSGFVLEIIKFIKPLKAYEPSFAPPPKPQTRTLQNLL